MKFLMYIVFFIFGLAVGVTTTESTWKEKLKFALEEREEVHKIMIDEENTVTKKEAYDEFLRTLWNSCIDGGGFIINNEETNETEIFKCSKEGDNDYTNAQWSKM